MLSIERDPDGGVLIFTGVSQVCAGCHRKGPLAATFSETRRLAELADWHSDGSSEYECPECQVADAE